MSYADKVFYTVIAVSIVISVLSLLKLVTSSYRELVTKKLVFTALLVTPLVQFFMVILTIQVYYANEIGHSTGGFICSGLHGGGLNTGCSMYEVIFEGVMASVIYSFVTLGLVPLVTFLVILLTLVSVKKYSSR